MTIIPQVVYNKIITDFNELCKTISSYKYKCVICKVEEQLGFVPTRPVDERYEEEELRLHIEVEHDQAIRRNNETEEEAILRLQTQNPRIGTSSCRCLACKRNRKAEREINQAMYR